MPNSECITTVYVALRSQNNVCGHKIFGGRESQPKYLREFVMAPGSAVSLSN